MITKQDSIHYWACTIPDCIFPPVKRQTWVVCNLLSPLNEPFSGDPWTSERTYRQCLKNLERRDSTLFCNISFSEQRSMKPCVGLFSSFRLQMRFKKVKLMKQLSYDRDAAGSHQVWDCGTVAMTLRSKHRVRRLWKCPPLIDGRLPLFSCKQMW